MALNYLYSRHQISLINAHAAACGEVRLYQLELARLYAARIDKLRRHKAGECSICFPLSHCR
jgi:hypothetical protein